MALEWWQKNVIYHVYLCSFKDSDGDGIGDLQGLISKLDYFCDLGVSSLLISPFYPSPKKDNGYDITDFVGIDPMYGTIEDFDMLMQEIKSRKMNIILDFVANHCSDEHEWFQKSIKREDPYVDYFTWKDPKPDSTNSDKEPPNNWLSVFGGSAWTWNDERQQFYFHQFLAEQPDFNYRNPGLMAEMEKILRFWLDKGVDGFRVDAASHLCEDERFLDEPRSKHSTANQDEHDYLDHIYTKGQEKTLDLLEKWRRVLDGYAEKDLKPRVMLIEAVESVQEIMQYYGTVHRKLADFPFNFQLYHVPGNCTGLDLRKLIDDWLTNMPKGKYPNWVLSSHDFPRVYGRVPPAFAASLQMATLLLPGVPVCYYGDELGMDNTPVRPEDTRDTFALRTRMENSRDPMRTPMQWNGEKNAGFTDCDSPWLPVNPNYVNLNVEAESRDPSSVLSNFRRMLELRKKPSVLFGTFEYVRVDDSTFCFLRNLVDSKSFLFVLNMSPEAGIVDLSRSSPLLPSSCCLEVTNCDQYCSSLSTASAAETNSSDVASTSFNDPSPSEPCILDLSNIYLGPHEAVVLSYTANVAHILDM